MHAFLVGREAIAPLLARARRSKALSQHPFQITWHAWTLPLRACLQQQQMAARRDAEGDDAALPAAQAIARPCRLTLILLLWGYYFEGRSILWKRPKRRKVGG